MICTSLLGCEDTIYSDLIGSPCTYMVLLSTGNTNLQSLKYKKFLPSLLYLLILLSPSLFLSVFYDVKWKFSWHFRLFQ